MELAFVYVGRIPSFKNSRMIVPIKSKEGKIRFNVVTNKKAASVMKQLAMLATRARQEAWENQMLPPKTPFTIDVEIHVKNATAPDLDGSIATLLDSLQGVLFDNDRYLYAVTAKRIINPRLINEFVKVRITDENTD